MQVAVFWVLTPCSLVGSQDVSVDRQKKEDFFFETTLNSYKSARCQNPEDHNLNIHILILLQLMYGTTEPLQAMILFSLDNQRSASLRRNKNQSEKRVHACSEATPLFLLSREFSCASGPKNIPELKVLSKIYIYPALGRFEVPIFQTQNSVSVCFNWLCVITLKGVSIYA